MNVVFVGRADSPVLAYLREVEAHVASTSRRLHRADPRVRGADFLVSHGYRHWIQPRLLARFRGRAVNLHNSLLPWNRGMDAALWSFVDDTPKGVTIHHMDAGLDTGDILVQREVRFAGDETLRCAWWRLQAELVELFEEHWPMIREGRWPARPQPAGGSYHRSADRNTVADLLTEGWDTPVRALTARRNPQFLTP
jgi:methionyl-tRNA formyltransferase